MQPAIGPAQVVVASMTKTPLSGPGRSCRASPKKAPFCIAISIINNFQIKTNRVKTKQQLKWLIVYSGAISQPALKLDGLPVLLTFWTLRSYKSSWLLPFWFEYAVSTY
jgi:hypothetical protein